MQRTHGRTTLRLLAAALALAAGACGASDPVGRCAAHATTGAPLGRVVGVAADSVTGEDVYHIEKLGDSTIVFPAVQARVRLTSCR